MKAVDDTRETTPLVSAQWLKENIDNPDIQIVEVDVSPVSYDEEHITGAVLWNIYSDLKDEDYHLRPKSSIEALVQKSGITENSIIVFYGYAPALGYWLMDYYDHPNIHVLNTSKETWKNNGYPLSSKAPSIKTSDYQLKSENNQVRTLHEELKGLLNSQQHTILDVRSKLEYDGERFWPSGGIPEGTRAGHIPSAKHIPADGIVKSDGSFMSKTELKEFFSNIDLSSDKQLITYCTIGARASTVWFALSQILGYKKARVYDGSWAQWGSDSSSQID